MWKCPVSSTIICIESGGEIEPIQDLKDIAEHRGPPLHLGDCILIVTCFVGRLVATAYTVRHAVQNVKARSHIEVKRVGLAGFLATSHQLCKSQPVRSLDSSVQNLHSVAACCAHLLWSGQVGRLRSFLAWT